MGLDVDPRFDVMWWGTVVQRKDPLGVGRVRARIPGLIALTTWARPAGARGASKGKGEIDPPPKNARVLLGFEGGNRESPFYFPGWWLRGETPPGHIIDDDGGDVSVFANEFIVIETDTRDSTKGWRIKDRATNGTELQIDFDPVTRQVGVTGTVGIRMETTGAIIIKGGSVSINGRFVRPIAKPI